MDLKGSLINTKLRIYPSENFLKFLKTISVTKQVPRNIVSIIQDENKVTKEFDNDLIDVKLIQLTDRDFQTLKKIKTSVLDEVCENKIEAVKTVTTPDFKNITEIECIENSESFLTVSDLDWLYLYLKKKHDKGEQAPFLNKLLETAEIKLPKNKVLKRNPDLEARCVKLRAQQEAREYRKMTKGVDNVRIRYPEDSISYQMKQLNRHLIAIGQFLLSIFAGFLFGFRGVEWMVGNLDFGFRLLLGVMCALVIALAEIYFLAKKLNEELSVPETVQLGGPAKFANQDNNDGTKKAIQKEHLD